MRGAETAGGHGAGGGGMKRTAVARPGGWLRLTPDHLRDCYPFIRRTADILARGDSTFAGAQQRRGGKSAGAGRRRS